jgi:radical SAM family protein
MALHRVMRNLEIHAAHACNLACESCSHYSNHGHKGVVSLEQARAALAPWSARLAPKVFSIVGGEPTLHPDLAAFCELARAMFPRATLRVVTNGFFLERHPRLPAWMAADRNAVLDLSIHHESPAYRERLDPVLELVGAWQREHRFQVELWFSSRNWTRRYMGHGAALEPFEDGNPRRSWESCRGCSEAELEAFLAREEEPHCGMCSADPPRFELPMPIRAVSA